MKIREVIQEFMPCDVCGNNDVKNFYFHVLVDKGNQPYVKCCECNEKYYSATAKNVLAASDVARQKALDAAEKALIPKGDEHSLVTALRHANYI